MRTARSSVAPRHTRTVSAESHPKSRRGDVGEAAGVECSGCQTGYRCERTRWCRQFQAAHEPRRPAATRQGGTLIVATSAEMVAPGRRCAGRYMRASVHRALARRTARAVASGHVRFRRFDRAHLAHDRRRYACEMTHDHRDGERDQSIANHAHGVRPAAESVVSTSTPNASKRGRFIVAARSWSDRGRFHKSRRRRPGNSGLIATDDWTVLAC